MMPIQNNVVFSSGLSRRNLIMFRWSERVSADTQKANAVSTLRRKTQYILSEPSRRDFFRHAIIFTGLAPVVVRVLARFSPVFAQAQAQARAALEMVKIM